MLAALAEPHHQPHDRVAVDIQGAFHGPDAVSLAEHLESQNLLFSGENIRHDFASFRDAANRGRMLMVAGILVRQFV